MSSTCRPAAASGTDGEPDPQGGVSVDFGRYGTLARRESAARSAFRPCASSTTRCRAIRTSSRRRRSSTRSATGCSRASAMRDLNLFRSDVSDLIDERGSGETGQFVNLQDAMLQGVEVAVGAHPLDWLRLDVNYTYLDAQARATRPADGFTAIQHRPRTASTASCRPSCRGPFCCASRACTLAATRPFRHRLTVPASACSTSKWQAHRPVAQPVRRRRQSARRRSRGPPRIAAARPLGLRRLTEGVTCVCSIALLALTVSCPAAYAQPCPGIATAAAR